MKKQLFEELIGSVREGGAIVRGHQKPARQTSIGAPGVREIRERTHLSQSELAQLIGVSIETLQNWEQGRNKPDPAALSLVRIFDQSPDLVLDAVYQPVVP